MISLSLALLILSVGPSNDNASLRVIDLCDACHEHPALVGDLCLVCDADVREHLSYDGDVYDDVEGELFAKGYQPGKY
jgi:hypothetical protein